MRVFVELGVLGLWYWFGGWDDERPFYKLLVTKEQSPPAETARRLLVHGRCGMLFVRCASSRSLSSRGDK